MKSKYNIGFLLLLFYTACIAQTNIQLKATYTAVLNLYQEAEKIQQQECRLLIDGPQSLFIFSPPADSVSFGNSVGTDDFGTPVLSMYKISKDTLYRRYFIDMEKQQLLSRELLFDKGESRPYLVEESLPRIRWSLKEDFKQLGKFKCQKAIGLFRGRRYTAWFTTAVPVNAGPWKLHGLPGLILEAYDDQRAAYFRCKDLVYPYGGALEVLPPTNGERISLREFVKLRRELPNRLRAYLLSKLPRGAEVDIQEVSNNQLELEFDFDNE